MSVGQARSKRPGIVDWKAKQLILKDLYAVGRPKTVVKKAAEPRMKELPADFIDKVSDSFRKWYDSRPSGERSMTFWRFVREDFNIDAPAEAIFDADVSTFIGFLQWDDQQQAILALRSRREHDLPESVVRDLEAKAPLSSSYSRRLMEPEVRYPAEVSIPSISDGLASGRIDHANFYLSLDASLAWDELVDTGEYDSFMACLASLEELFRSDEWQKLLEEGSHDAFVMLGGGGAPEKDLAMIRSVRSRDERPLEYVLLDASYYMITRSLRVLQRSLPAEGLHERVHVWGFAEGNFLNLEEFQYLSDRRGRTVWAITGGTFGNCDEREFFRSLSGRAAPGDLLLVSADTIDTESAEALEKRMQGEYATKELNALLLPPLRLALAGRDARRELPDDGYDIEGVFVTVEPEEGSDGSRHSHVPGSLSAVFTALVDGERTLLATSTRYREAALIEFAVRYQWRHAATVASPKKSDFKQFLFQRY